MSKLDLLSKDAKNQLEKYLEPDMSLVLAEEMAEDERLVTRFQKLNQALATLVGIIFISFCCTCIISSYVTFLVPCSFGDTTYLCDCSS